MVRSTAALAALAALLIFPGIALAQEEPETQPGSEQQEERHTVERGESLWSLARRYFDDPFEWRRIFEANEGEISDPNWIYPGQHFTIPGAGTQVTGVEVEGGEEAGEEEEEGRARTERMASRVYPGPNDPTVFSDPAREDIPSPAERTRFYGTVDGSVVQRGGVMAGDRVEHFAVSRHTFYASPWRVPEENQDNVAYPGRVTGWAGSQAAERARTTLNPFDRIELRWAGEEPPAVGSEVHLVRVGRSQEGFGSVIEPTGLARVVERGDGAVVAVLEAAFARPRLGNYALRAERFPLERGQYSEATDDGLTATLTGFAAPSEIQQVGDVAFLSVGSDDGVRVGDVFSVQVSGGGGWTAEEAVRFQVIRIFEDRSSARVTNVTTPVFSPGTELHRIRRMP